MERGYIKLWRKTLDNQGLCSNPYCFNVFMHFLLRAEWKDGRKIWVRATQIELKAGQLTYGRKELSRSTGISHQSLRSAVAMLKSTNLVTIQPTTKFTIVTILNWDTYQQDIIHSNHKHQPQTSTNTQPTLNHSLRSKEFKNNMEKPGKAGFLSEKQKQIVIKDYSLKNGVSVNSEAAKIGVDEIIKNIAKTKDVRNPIGLARHKARNQ